MPKYNSRASIKYSVSNTQTIRLAPLTLAVSGSLAMAGTGTNVIEVTTLAGAGTPGECTLHDAVMAVNSQTAYGNCPGPTADYPTIAFASGLNGTITTSDSLVISDSVRIDGDERIGVELASTASGSVLIAEDSVEHFTIDGLTVSGGYASSGGGIYSQATHFTLHDSVISSNIASQSGGGVHHVSPPDGEVEIRDSEFLSNYAAYTGGGGLSLDKTGEGSVTVRDNAFEENSSVISGGAVLVMADQADDVVIKYNSFDSNDVTLGMGGGLAAYLNNGEAGFKYNQFIFNESELGNGGAVALEVENQNISTRQGVYFYNAAYYTGGAMIADLSEDSYLYIDQALAQFNGNSFGGGAAYVTGNNAELVINRSDFFGNGADFGGGLALIGDFARFEMVASRMVGNSADTGGHILLGTENSEITGDLAIRASELYYSLSAGGIEAYLGDDTDLLVSNSTIVLNYASDFGAIKAVGSGTLRVAYSTLSNNAAASGGSGVYASVPCSVRNSIFANTVDPDRSELAGSSTCSVRHSLITDSDGSNFSNDGGNLLDVDPELLEFDDHGGYPTRTRRIARTSPAIDAGQDFGNAPAYDQRGPGFERISGDGLDMGAYEFQVQLFHDRFEEP